MLLIARCVEGTEEIVLKELSMHGTVSRSEIFKGIILFDFIGELHDLLEIKTCNDILYLIKKFSGITRYPDSLFKIKKQLSGVNLNKTIAVLAKIRKFPKIPVFNVHVSYTGRRDYTAKDIEFLVIKAIKKNYSWLLGENSNLNVSLIFTPEISLCGASLKKVPFHVEKKIETVPGSIKSSLANVLIDLGEIKSSDVVLDPMCGSGIIAIESSKYCDKCIAGDIDKTAVKLAKKNAESRKSKVEFHIWDARRTGLEIKSTDKIISNLPLGKQVKLETGFWAEFIAEMHSISRANSRWVFLASEAKLFREILNKYTDLRILKSISITNSGLESVILVIEKA